MDLYYIILSYYILQNIAHYIISSYQNLYICIIVVIYADAFWIIS